MTAAAVGGAAAIFAAIASGGMLMLLANVFTLGFACYLAFWPGRAHDEPSSFGGGLGRGYDVKEAPGSARLEAALEAALARRAAAATAAPVTLRAPGAVARPMAAAGGGRPSFGRRG
jgi:hypothetical protein